MKKNLLLKMHKKMLMIRLFEEKLNSLFLQGKIPGTLHLYNGQEACAVGVCENLNNQDWILSTHRPHGHAIAKGVSINSIMAELFAKETGCCGGFGGSMHLIDLNNNFYGSTAIVSNSIPVGVGLAYSIKINKQKNIVCIYIGDASLEEGVFFESINFCIIKKLPVIFICENNFYSVYTHLKDRQPKQRKIFKLAKALGAVSYKFSQNNPFKLYLKLQKLFNKIRNNPTPHFVEIETYRYLEHCGPNDDTKLGYRSLEEVKKWKNKDPVVFSRNYLIKKKLFNKKKLDSIDSKIVKNIDKEFNYIKKLKKPKFKDIENLVYKK